MKKKELKELLPVILVSFMAILCLVSLLLLPGISKKMFSEINSTVSSVSFKGIVFGGGPIVATTNEREPVPISYQGGVSTFGVISFALLILAIIMVASSTFIKGKKADSIGEIVFMVGSGIMILSGITMFMLLVGGSDLVSNLSSKITDSFTKTFNGFSLSVGPILYGIFAILGGGLGFAKKYIVNLIKD